MKEQQERVKFNQNKIITLPINLNTSFIRKKYTGKERNSEVVDLNVRNSLHANEDSGDEMLTFYIPKGDRLSFASDHLNQMVLNKMLYSDTKSKENMPCIRSKSNTQILTTKEIKSEPNLILKSNLQQLKYEEIKGNENSFSHLFENTKRKISYEDVSTGTNQNKAVKYSESNMTNTFNDSFNYFESSTNIEGQKPTYEKKKCQKITHKRNLSENILIKSQEKRIYFKEDSCLLPDSDCRGRNDISQDVGNSGRKNKLSIDETLEEKRQDYFTAKNKEDNHKRTKSNLPFERIKEKLEDEYVEFLKKHRFSSVLTGNKKYEGKTGDYYLMLNNLDTKNDVNIINNRQPEFSHFTNNNQLNYYHNDLNKSSNKNEKEFKEFIHESKNEFITEKENLSTAKSTNKKSVKPQNKSQNNITNHLTNHRESLNTKLTNKQEIASDSKKKIHSKKINKNSPNEYSTHANISHQNKSNMTKKEINTNNYNTTTKQKTNNQKKSSFPLFIFDIDETKPLKGIEKLVSQTKNAIDLTPIPTKNNTKKLKVIEKEYTKAERAAVLIRRIEYSFGIKNKKDEMIKEAQNLYLELVLEAKVVIIQRWWRKIKKYFELLKKSASTIQKIVRGYFSRKVYSIALRAFNCVYPFAKKLINIISRNFLVYGFEILYSKYAILAQKKFVLQLIKLIQRQYRIHLKKIKIKRKLISRSIYLVGKNIISNYFGKIRLYDRKKDKFTKLQAFYKGRIFRGDEENMYKLGREVHPFLFYFLKYKKDKSIYNFKKEKFYFKFCKTFLFVKNKKKIPHFVEIISSLSRRIIRERNFSFIMNKLQNFKFFKLKINFMSKYLKDVIRIINLKFKQKEFEKWKTEFIKERNKCRLAVKVYSVIFKIFIWRKFLNKAQIKIKYKMNIKKFIQASYILNKLTCRKIFFLLKKLITRLKKRGELIKNFLSTKSSKIKKNVFEKFKKNMYFSIYFPRSYKIDKAFQIIKYLFSSRIIKDYKDKNEKVFLNLKHLFLEQRKKTKLKKVFNISKVYYLHKEKIHFDKFCEISEKLREIDFERMNKLEILINRINHKKILMKKIRFLKFVLKCFRRKIHESKREIASLKNMDKTVSINQGRMVISNIILTNLKKVLEKIKTSVLHKDKLINFLGRTCFITKTNQNKNKLFFMYKLKTYSLERKNLTGKRNQILKNLILRKISQSIQRNKFQLQKFYYAWKIQAQNSDKRNISDFSVPNNLSHINKIRNKMFADKLNKSLKSRLFTLLITKTNNYSKLNLLLKSIHYHFENAKSCRCRHLNHTQACEKLFLFRFNSERKIKRIMFDKYKLATGLLFINTYSRGTQMIFKRKVTKNDKRKNIMKFLIKNMQNLQSDDIKRKKLFFAKWKNINANFQINSAALIIQKYMRLKFLQKKNE